MNPFFLTPRERLALWRDMRNSLAGLDNVEKFPIVAKWFAQAPLEKIILDPECSANWRDPWSLINDNDWCPVSVAIAIEATLRLSGVEDITVAWIIERRESIETMVVVVDNMVLNYDVGCVISRSELPLIVVNSWIFGDNSYVPQRGIATK